MKLEDQIIKQFNKKKNPEKLYSGGYYVDNVRKEVAEQISLFLKKEFKNLSDLSILEIGAGNGSNAEIFTSNGIKLSNIYFNELLPERILAIKNKYPNNTLYEGNAIDVNIDRKFDIIFQSTVFTSILSDEHRKALAEKMWCLLKPNGIILWYDFIYNNPNNPDVKKVEVQDLKKLFPKLNDLYYKKITLAPPIGRRVGRFYKLFNIPILRSHILAMIK